MSNRPVGLVAVFALVVGFGGGWYVGRKVQSPTPPAAVAPAPGKPASGPAGPKSAAQNPARPVTVGGFQFEGMDFDTTAEFKSPQTSFPKAAKIYFRIKLRATVPPGSAPPNGKITYRRLGKSTDKNGPIRKIGSEDIQPAGKDTELYAFRPGLTFMSNPPDGTTTFEVYIDGKPVGRSSFQLGPGK